VNERDDSLAAERFMQPKTLRPVRVTERRFVLFRLVGANRCLSITSRAGISPADGSGLPIESGRTRVRRFKGLFNNQFEIS
jgi:hypothetical protein